MQEKFKKLELIGIERPLSYYCLGGGGQA